MPLHPVKWPSVTPPISSLKLYARYGSTRTPVCAVAAPCSFPCCAASGIATSLGRDIGAGHTLADFENDELCRFDRSESDHDVHTAGVNLLRRVGLFVAFDEEGLLRRASHQRALSVNQRQKRLDVAGDPRPERMIVRLE